MKILFISYHFGPSNVIAAVRTTKIAKYLTKLGNDVSVICGPPHINDPTLLNDIKTIKNIEVIYNPSSFNKLIGNTITKYNYAKLKTKKKSCKFIILNFIRNILPNPAAVYFDFLHSITWYRSVRYRSKLLYNKYDIIFSSFGPLASHLLGLYAKKLNNEAIWIADYRDSMFDSLKNDIIKMIYKWYQYVFLKNADLSFCVSKGLARSIIKINNNANVYIIQNGFDYDDIKYINTKYKKSNKLIFTYCGALYNGKRDLTPLFRALNNLMKARALEKNDIEIHYAGNEFNILLNIAVNYGLEEVLINHGFISRDEALALTAQGDVALLATWNTAKSQGVITGKIYELFMLKKEIICFISGDLPNSELRKMIENANAGFVYEDVSSNINDLEKHLLILYRRKYDKKLDISNYNEEYIQNFSYNNIASQINELLIQKI
jgi:hypothetical protein